MFSIFHAIIGVFVVFIIYYLVTLLAKETPPQS